MISYMVGKLAPNSSHLTWGLVNCTPVGPVGAIFVPFPPKTETYLLHPPIVERVRVLYKVVLLLYRVILRLGLTAGCISSLCSGWEASLRQALHVREPQPAAETATAELCWSNGKMVRLKSNRSKMSPCSMVLRPSVQVRSRNFSAWSSFRVCSEFSLKE